jgi:hypothetical protein
MVPSASTSSAVGLKSGQRDELSEVVIKPLHNALAAPRQSLIPVNSPAFGAI